MAIPEDIIDTDSPPEFKRPTTKEEWMALLNSKLDDSNPEDPAVQAIQEQLEAFVDDVLKGDRIREQALLNLQDNLAPDVLVRQIEKRTRIMEEAAKTDSDRTRLEIREREKDTWTAELLATDTTNAMNPWRAIQNFAGSLWYNLVSFWTGDIKHADGYAHRSDMAKDYDPRPGDEKLDMRELMPDVYASFERKQEERARAASETTVEREARGLDGAGEDLRRQFPASAADVRRADVTPAPALDVTLDT